ncbi:ABC transporter ATP-binding protein [Clostridium hydrogenum]|uniref:ABC transporter ATP-binding protein n=1 Tax=Clostridium hydrogenum TaxID=2855764 RepID=UPI001F169EDB|nr:ABC transporter ATP-binding protein [Clostridium hydrogenum]
MLKKIYLGDLFRMISLMKKKKWIYILVLILSCGVNATSNIISAYVNKNVISAAESGKMYFLISGAVLAVIAFLMGCIIFPMCIYLKVRIIKHVLVKIKLDLFKHIEKLPISYYENSHSGELMSRLINDVNSMENAYNDQMQMIGVGGIGSTITMISLDWRLAIITIIMGVISARIDISYSSPLRKIANNIQNSLGILNQHLSDILSGFCTARMFNISSLITDRFINESNIIAGQTIERAKKNSQLSCINYISGVLSMVGIYIVGAFMVTKNMLDFSTVVAIVALQKGVNFMFLNLGNFFVQLQSSLAGASRIFEILDEAIEKEGYMVNGNIPENSMIALRNVRFAYKGQSTILKNFNLKVSKNSIVALVGASGVGKSTIIKFLLGFYEVNYGEITIGEKLISEYTLKELRELMAYVPQDAYLFDGTIEENIRYGKMDASKDEIIEAARLANAHDFIMKMPNKYSTKVGEGGVKLSGGQKQCISIARAFIKNSPIILLDEATSALDSESEQLAQKGLKDLMKGRTALVIAHRLTTIKNADMICVIEGGKIAEYGKHEDLIRKSGRYMSLYSMYAD